MIESAKDSGNCLIRRGCLMLPQRMDTRTPLERCAGHTGFSISLNQTSLEAGFNAAICARKDSVSAGELI